MPFAFAASSEEFAISWTPRLRRLYNVERAEVASGPNSILFGLGPAGGLGLLTGKKANVRRTRTSLKTVFSENDYQRYRARLQPALLRDRLALRLLGLHHTSEGWRKWTRDDQDRFTGAVTLKPFKQTSIDASYEQGRRYNSLAVTGNAIDAASLWLANNRPTADGRGRAGHQSLFHHLRSLHAQRQLG
jgi:outer membrane receptor protein involved in Fe transport